METLITRVYAHLEAEAELVRLLRRADEQVRQQAADILAKQHTGREAFIASTLFDRVAHQENPQLALQQLFNWTAAQANTMYDAGRGFAHTKLGPSMEEHELALGEAAAVVREAEALKNGQHKLNNAAKVLARGNFESKQHMAAALKRDVKQKNIAAAEAKRKAKGLVPELLMRAGAPGYKDIMIKNVDENHADIIYDMVSNAISGLGEADRRGTPAQVMGRAALLMLSSMSGGAAGGYTDGRITSVFVVNEAGIDGAAIFNRKGQLISPEEFAEIKAQWQKGEDFVAVYDENGRIVSLMRTRLATKQQRIILMAEQGGCCFPDCNETRVHAHHMLPVRIGGDTDTNNLVLLCPRHHRIVEKRPGDFYLDRKRGISQFVLDDGSIHRGMAYHPHVPAMVLQARLFDIDLDAEHGWRSLRRALLRE
ncbi:MAG: HNH endonuclease signature motif containing protein [Corynebacterium sp.]|nr:HNH endonuclease signature motif containing protein [Corynebacterium sp.]